MMKYAKEYITELIEILELFNNNETVTLSHVLLKKFIKRHNLIYRERGDVTLYWEEGIVAITYDTINWNSLCIGFRSHYGFNDLTRSSETKKDISLVIQKIKSYELKVTNSD